MGSKISGSIRLHPKHGLNSTISTCILCGKDKNEIVLLGAAYKEQAPMHMVTSLEPCDECKAKYLTDGIMLAEVDIDKNLTGRVVVIKVEAFQKLFSIPVPPKHITIVEQGLLNKIGVISNGKQPRS